MTATTLLQGRTGNNWYQIAHLIAYASKWGMNYYIPDFSPHCPGGVLQFDIKGTSDVAPTGMIFKEIEPAKYQEIPFINNVRFKGYWQSFKYIDDFRETIINATNLPYKIVQNRVSIHVRRGDFLNLPSFKVMPLRYYRKAIYYFKERGYSKFYVFSDDINWCKNNFNEEIFPNCDFVFIEGNTEIQDFSLMSSCEHNICANSSFSFAASWLNRNNDKVVLCPPKKDMWYNLDMVPDYFTQIDY